MYSHGFNLMIIYVQDVSLPCYPIVFFRDFVESLLVFIIM